MKTSFLADKPGIYILEGFPRRLNYGNHALTAYKDGAFNSSSDRDSTSSKRNSNKNHVHNLLSEHLKETNPNRICSFTHLPDYAQRYIPPYAPSGVSIADESTSKPDVVAISLSGVILQLSGFLWKIIHRARISLRSATVVE